MTQRYASSVYSQKSIKSAKSTRSYLSVGHSMFTQGTVWNHLKRWLPGKKKKKDSDSISSSSISKLKRLWDAKSLSVQEDGTPTLDPASTLTDSVIETGPRRTIEPVGILVNRPTDSERSIEARKERRRQRQRENRWRLYEHLQPSLSSSSDSLTTPPDETEPRILFVEPSPVPRFRNLPPPPPPSPPYLSILIDDRPLRRTSVIESPTDGVPTVYTEPVDADPSEKPVISIYDRRLSLLIQSLAKTEKRHRLQFHRPYHPGQVLTFSLQNTLPEDHILLFKFMTRNTASGTERYLIRPSAGKMDSIQSTEVMLFLNQVPPERVRDTIMIRWAIIQRGSDIARHVDQLQESTRRKWIELLEEQWPDQFTIKMTKIKIDFL